MQHARARTVRSADARRQGPSEPSRMQHAAISPSGLSRSWALRRADCGLEADPLDPERLDSGPPAGLSGSGANGARRESPRESPAETILPRAHRHGVGGAGSAVSPSSESPSPQGSIAPGALRVLAGQPAERGPSHGPQRTRRRADAAGFAAACGFDRTHEATGRTAGDLLPPLVGGHRLGIAVRVGGSARHGAVPPFRQRPAITAGPPWVPYAVRTRNARQTQAARRQQANWPAEGPRDPSIDYLLPGSRPNAS